jgi:hypothetical protein
MKAPRDEIGNALIALKEKATPSSPSTAIWPAPRAPINFKPVIRRPFSKWASPKVLQ